MLRGVIFDFDGVIVDSERAHFEGFRIVLSESALDQLFHEVNAFPGFELIVDLPAQQVSTTGGSVVFPFEIDAFRKDCLVNGLDEIGLTLQKSDKIREYEARRLAEQPWLTKTLTA